MSRKTVGTGLWRSEKVSVDVATVGPEPIHAMFEAYNARQGWRWDAGLAEWRAFLAAHLPRADRCPGRDDPRCCGFDACTGALWRELDDIEWCLKDADWHLRLVERLVEEGDANGAARFALKLGERLVHLQMKLGPEAVWETGRQSMEARSRGGGHNRDDRLRAERLEGIAEIQRKRPSLSGRACARSLASQRPDLGSEAAIYKTWKQNRGQR